jgi:hypothetical protein
MYDVDDEHTTIDDQLAARIATAEAGRRPHPRGEVLVVASASSGERFAGRRGQGSTWIGTAASVEWRLDHSGVADRHVELVFDDTSLWICAHVAATLDGRKLLGWAPARSGSRLVLGDVSVELQHLGALATECQADAIPERDAGERFAMPPADEGRASRRPRRSWRGPAVSVAIVAAAAAAAWAFRSRGVEAAVDTTAGREGPPVTVALPPPSARTPSAPGERAVLRAAAQALLSHDYRAALDRYRELADAEGAAGVYAAFVRALEARIAALEPGDAE